MADLPSTLFYGGTWVDTLSVVWRLGRPVLLTHVEARSCATEDTMMLDPDILLLVVVVLCRQGPNGSGSPRYQRL